MKNYLFVIFFVALAGGTYFGIELADKWLNYTRTSGDVIVVEKICYLEKREKAFKTNHRRMTSKKGPCDDIKRAAAIDRRFQGYSVIEENVVSVTYQDDSGATRTGKLVQNQHADGRAIRVGDKLEFLRHNKSPAILSPL